MLMAETMRWWWGSIEHPPRNLEVGERGRGRRGRRGRGREAHEFKETTFKLNKTYYLKIRLG
jgi:hypothetical protein